MNSIDIDNTHFQRELKEALAALEKHSDTWPENESMARMLHWMKDPLTQQYFEKAATVRIRNLKRGRIQGWELMVIGNYFRLAGDSELAGNYFLRAYEQLKTQVGDIGNPNEIRYPPIETLIPACFFLGKYEEVIMCGHLLQNHLHDPNAMAYKFVLLAEAQITTDKAKVATLVDSLATDIDSALKAGRIKIQDDFGYCTSFDLYELAVEMLDEMEKQND